MSLNPLGGSKTKLPIAPPSIQVDDLTLPLTNEEDDTSPTKLNSRRKTRTFPRRSGIRWQKKWSKTVDPFRNGRVLIVDCFSRTASDDNRRKTQSQEFTSARELDKYYAWNSSEANKNHQPCLRIIHVQNAVWARQYFSKRYDILAGDRLDAAHNAFAKWIHYDKPQRRAGFPLLNAKAFPMERDVFRRVWRCAFGLDYLRYFEPGHFNQEKSLDKTPDQERIDDFKLASLWEWKEDSESNNDSFPEIGPDLFAQRLSIYVQRNMDEAGIDEDDWDDASSSASDLDREERPRKSASPKDVDNSTTVIFFESSHSRLVNDTLIEARSEIERHFRTIFTDLPKQDIESDSELGLQCLDLALGYVIRGLTTSWEKLISKCDEHLSVLEERVFSNPADESRAPDLWENSSLWLKLEKLLSLQNSALASFRSYLTEISLDVQRKFLNESPDQFSRVQTLIDEDLNKPTTALTDLVFKSVDIRDSRHNMQLNSSLWRLSWLSFTFLPLNTLSSFMGMNVNTFQPPDGNFPAIWWYFVIAIPLLIFTFLATSLLRSVTTSVSVDPLRRSIYEGIFEQFAESRPDLWHRLRGPRLEITMQGGSVQRAEWALLKRWFAPDRTVNPGAPWKNPTAVIGISERIQVTLASRWLPKLKQAQERKSLSEAMSSDATTLDGAEKGQAMNSNGAPSHRKESPRGSPDNDGKRGRSYARELTRSRSGGGSPANSATSQTSTGSDNGLMVEEEETNNDADEKETRGRIWLEERKERKTSFENTSKSPESQKSPSNNAGPSRGAGNKLREPSVKRGIDAMLGVTEDSRQILTRNITKL